MSLLMKALEKAAKDRGEARNEPAPAAASSAAAGAAAPAGGPARSELSLEPMGGGGAASAAPRTEAAPRVPPQGREPGMTAPPHKPRDPAPAQAQAQAQASTVIQAQSASRPAGSAVGDYVRAHPIVVFGTIAGLIALGFALYVYLQIFHPALFVGRPPLATKAPLPPLTQAPVIPAPPAQAPGAPLSSAPLLKEAAEAPPAAAAPVAPRPRPGRSAPESAPEEAPRNAISVTVASAEPVLNPLHRQAYDALQAGQADEAERLYRQLASAEPRNVQALLGLAALAARQGNTEDATRRYLRILELEPRNALAQSGLIALLGRADPLAAESRLKQLIAREPSAHLHFTLGNLYADQSQWAAAQQAYFQAHHLDSANPDYAYNLGVALEHVSQPRLALGFYQRALQLAAARGRANFNLQQARERVDILAQRAQ